MNYTDSMEMAVNAAECEAYTQEAFEALCAGCTAEDIGGIILYFKGALLAGFYDYEFEHGHKFAQLVA